MKPALKKKSVVLIMESIFDNINSLGSFVGTATTISEYFLKKPIDNYKWKRVFIDAGKAVADFEVDDTEDSAIRRATFAEDAMEKLSKEMGTVNSFDLIDECDLKVSALVSQFDFSPDNALLCHNMFINTLFEGLDRAFPILMLCARVGHIYKPDKEINLKYEASIYSQPYLGDISHLKNSNGTASDIPDGKFDASACSQEYQHESNEKGNSDESGTAKYSEWHLEELKFTWRGDEEEIKSHIVEFTACWKKEREDYPGWYIAPASKCEELRWKTTSFTAWLNLNFIPPDQNLEFCYEYIWRSETAMLCYDSNTVQKIRNVWNNCDPDNKENTWIQDEDHFDHWFECGMMLLREYRERGEETEWENIFRSLTRHAKNIKSAGIRLKIEEIKFAFSKLDMGKVRRLRENLDIPDDEYEMRLTKCGMEAECGDAVNALEHAEKLKSDIQSKLDSDEALDDQRIYLSSLYAVLLRFESMLQQGVAFTSGRYGENKEDITLTLQEAEKYVDYFDWDGTVDYVKKGLLKWETKRAEKRPPFELNKQTIPLFEDHPVSVESYYLYRVIDKMSIPLECCHVTLLGDVMLPWAEALQELNPQLALFIMLRGNKKNSVTVCYDRKHLLGLGHDQVSKQLHYLTEVFNNNLDELSEKGAWNSKGVCFSLRSMLLEIMPRCMVYCPDDIQREILILLRDIMSSEYLHADRNTLQFLSKMLSVISEKNKVLMLNDMLKTKIFDTPDTPNDDPPTQSEDIFELYFRKENLSMYTPLVKIDESIINDLLSNQGDSKPIRRSKIVRLTMLHYLGLLSTEQDLALTKKIWSQVDTETGLPDLDWDLWNSLDLNYGDAQCPIISIKHQLLNGGMKKLYLNDQGYQITWGNIPYLQNLITVSVHQGKDFWSVEDVETIFQDALDYWNFVKQQLQENKTSFTCDDLKLCIRNMFLMMAEVYKSISGTVQEKMQEEINSMLDEAQELNFATARLRAFFIPEDARKAFTENLGRLMRSPDNDTAVDAISCAGDLLEKYPDEIWTENLFENLLSFLYNRTQPGLETAIIIFHNMLYRNSPVLTGERIREIDSSLTDLGEWSEYSYHFESEDTVKEMAKIRKACTGLAYQIMIHADADEWPGVQYWIDNCNEQEFNDVKNEMLLPA